MAKSKLIEVDVVCDGDYYYIVGNPTNDSYQTVDEVVDAANTIFGQPGKGVHVHFIYEGD